MKRAVRPQPRRSGRARACWCVSGAGTSRVSASFEKRGNLSEAGCRRSWPLRRGCRTICSTAPISRARSLHLSEPGSPRVDAFDAMVVARVREGGRVPGGRACEWTTFGRSSARSTPVGVCSICAGVAITDTSTARTGATTPSVRESAVSRNSGTGGAAGVDSRRRFGLGASELAGEK